MSVINTNSPGPGALLLNRGQEMLGRSLTQLSSTAKAVSSSDDAATLALSQQLGFQSARAKAASTDLQQAVSRAQTSDGLIGEMSKGLSRMSELATLSAREAKNPGEFSPYRKEFSTLQDQLRGTIGGTIGEIGGTTDINAPRGTFNGAPLFGAAPAGVTSSISGDAGQDVTVGETNLRSGAMLEVIQQDAAGSYTLEVNDPEATRKIGGGLQQIASERASLGEAKSRLEFAATRLTVEVENLSSAMRIGDTASAAASTASAQASLRGAPQAAMLAQANQVPKTVLQLLQS